MLDGFQAGLSWITILRKRENFRRAFDGFEPEKIARYRPAKIEKLMQDAGIVRNRAKIEGAVLSARAWLESWRKARAFRRCCGTSSTAARRSTASTATKQVPAETDDLAQDVEGAAARGFKFCRPDHRLCLHAGGRHGQRSSASPAIVMQACAKLDNDGHERSLRASPSPTAAPRAWQRMLSGRRLDLLDPSPLDVEIEDIAHGLARVARWNGQTNGAHIFSVAQHIAAGRGAGARASSRGSIRTGASRSCCTMRRNTSSAT